MEQQAPVMSSIILRLPQKTSGLFDIGFAGGAADVTSLDLNALVDFVSDPCSGEGLNLTDVTSSDPIIGVDDVMSGKLGSVHKYEMDSFDLLDPLADLETDQLMDDGLDAFMNLEQFLMEDTFEDSNLIPPEELSAVNKFSPPYAEPSVLPTTSEKSRKRKAGSQPAKSKTVKTRLFEIPETLVEVIHPASPQLDHDYTTKCHKNLTTSFPISDLCKEQTVTEFEFLFVHDQPSTSTYDATLLKTDEPQVDKQTIRRIKNNVASKRSREQRKQKFVDLDLEAERLTQANEELRKKIVELEATAKQMKAQLVSKMLGQ